MVDTNTESYVGNPKVSPTKSMSKTTQNFNNGQYVNYINGIPVSELSPEMNKKGRFLN